MHQIPIGRVVVVLVRVRVGHLGAVSLDMLFFPGRIIDEQCSKDRVEMRFVESQTQK